MRAAALVMVLALVSSMAHAQVPLEHEGERGIWLPRDAAEQALECGIELDHGSRTLELRLEELRLVTEHRDALAVALERARAVALEASASAAELQAQAQQSDSWFGWGLLLGAAGILLAGLAVAAL